MADLNARIVARLPPAELRQSCHDVFRDDMANISDRLHEVVKEMARLEDVEAAVSQLQEGKSGRRRLKRLMALVADTVRVKSELQSKLRRMKLGLRAAAVDTDEGNAFTRTDRPADRRSVSKVKLEAVATDSVRPAASRPSPSSSGSRRELSSSSDASASDSSASDSSASDMSGSAAEESEDEADVSAVQPTKKRAKVAAAAQPATKPSATPSVENVKEESQKEIEAGESSDSERSEDSDDSASSSDSDIADPSDLIKELAWEVEAPATAGSGEPSGKRVGKRKRLIDEQGAVKHTLKTMLAYTASSLANINAAFGSNSRDEAVEELQRLLAGIMNKKSAINPTDKLPAVAEAIDRVSRSIKKTPMSFKEYTLVGKTAATIKRLVKARPTQCSALKRARADLTKAISVVKYHPALQRDFNPWFSLVLRLDAKAPADRCRRIEEVTSALVRSMPEYAKDCEVRAQLASGIRLIILWAKDLPAKGLQSLRNFRQAVLKCANDLPTEGHAADVKRFMGVLQQEIVQAEVRLPQQAEEALHEKLGQSFGMAADSSAQPERGNPSSRAVDLANIIRCLSDKQRDEWLDELLGRVEGAFQVTSAKDVRREYGRQSANLKRAVDWTLSIPMTLSRVERCQKFLQSVRRFAERIPNEGNRAGLLRSIEPL